MAVNTLFVPQSNSLHEDLVTSVLRIALASTLRRPRDGFRGKCDISREERAESRRRVVETLKIAGQMLVSDDVDNHYFSLQREPRLI
jgi:hypothetical protein